MFPFRKKIKNLYSFLYNSYRLYHFCTIIADFLNEKYVNIRCLKKE